MPAKRDCIKAVQSAMKEGEISEAAAEKLLAEMTRRAQHRATLKGISIDNAVKEIAGEMQKTEQTLKLLDRRNQLMTIQKARLAQEFAERFPIWAQGLAAYEVGSVKTSIEGAGGRIDPQWQGLNARYMGRLYAALEQAGVLHEFRHGQFSREFFLESGALATGQRATKNEAAFKMAKLWAELRKELVARLNRAGAFIQDLPDYVITQTHDMDRIRKDGGTGWGPEHRKQSYEQWKAFVLDKLDHERTFEGADPDTFLRKAHEKLYAGDHTRGVEDTDVAKVAVHGTLAQKISSGRVLWFRDADAAWQYNQRYGVKDYHQSIAGFIRNATRNIAMMENLGPNPQETLKRVLQNLKAKADDFGDRRQIDALKKYEPRIEGYFKLLAGHQGHTVNPTLSKWVDGIKAWTIMSKLGSVLFSAVADKATFQSTMAYNGIGHLDAFGKQLTALVGGSKDRSAMARQLGIVPQSFIGNVAARYGFEARANRQVDGWLNRFMSMTGLTLWTDRHMDAAADLLAWNLGENAGKTFDELPPDVHRMLRHYDIKPVEWDAIRKTAWADDEGERFITADQFSKVTDAELDAIAVAHGLSATPSNRNRMRDQMESKFQAYIIDQTRSAVPTPGTAEHYITTMGAQQRGTLLGEAAQLIFLFKTFPITVMRKVVGREIYGRGYDTIGQWLAHDHKGQWNLAMLIAMSAVAGYTANTLKDLAKGRTPRALVDEDGGINQEVWFAALARGGGMGILGDALFTEYDRQYKSFLSSAAGPVLGQLDPIAALVSKARKLGDDSGITPESIGAEGFNLMLNNTPMINLFYVRPVLDYFVFWHLKEMLSPGVLQRHIRSVEGKNHQEYYISPASGN